MLPTLPMAVSCKAPGRDAVQEHEHDIGLVGTLYQAAARVCSIIAAPPVVLMVTFMLVIISCRG